MKEPCFMTLLKNMAPLNYWPDNLWSVFIDITPCANSLIMRNHPSCFWLCQIVSWEVEIGGFLQYQTEVIFCSTRYRLYSAVLYIRHIQVIRIRVGDFCNTRYKLYSIVLDISYICSTIHTSYSGYVLQYYTKVSFYGNTYKSHTNFVLGKLDRKGGLWEF